MSESPQHIILKRDNGPNMVFMYVPIMLFIVRGADGERRWSAASLGRVVKPRLHEVPRCASQSMVDDMLAPATQRDPWQDIHLALDLMRPKETAAC